MTALGGNEQPELHKKKWQELHPAPAFLISQGTSRGAFKMPTLRRDFLICPTWWFPRELCQGATRE